MVNKSSQAKGLAKLIMLLFVPIIYYRFRVRRGVLNVGKPNNLILEWKPADLIFEWKPVYGR